ncbi:MAG: hypothetical protein AAF668_11470 [Pseudomonadota bacterium]
MDIKRFAAAFVGIGSLVTPASAQFAALHAPQAIEEVMDVAAAPIEAGDGRFLFGAQGAGGRFFFVQLNKCDSEEIETAQCESIWISGFLPDAGERLSLTQLNELHNEVFTVQAFIDPDGDLAVEYWTVAAAPVPLDNVVAALDWWKVDFDAVADNWAQAIGTQVSYDVDVPPGQPMPSDTDEVDLNAKVLQRLAQPTMAREQTASEQITSVLQGADQSSIGRSARDYLRRKARLLNKYKSEE